MAIDPISLALGLLGGGGGSTEVSTSQSVGVNTVASPIVGVSLGGGTVSPSGGGSATGSPSASSLAQSVPSSGGSLFPSFSPAPGVNDLDDVQFQSAGVLGGLFSDPMILLAMAGVAYLFFTQGK